MPVLPVQIIAPTFPEGYCPPSVQIFANDFAAGARLSSSITLDKVVISDSAPTDHTKLWFKTVGGVPFPYPSIPLYFWHPGLTAWVAAHPEQPGRHTWEEFVDASQIDTFDGGTAGVPSDMAGPFWAIDPAYNGRSPMSPGLIPGTSPAKTLGYKEDYGEGQHTQTADEVGPHTHPLDADASLLNGDKVKIVTSGSGGAGLFIGNTGTASTDLAVKTNKFTTSQVGFNVVHPVRGMSCIVRTARLFYQG